MAAGGLGAARPDQHYEPPAGGQAITGARGVVRARQVIIIGGNPPGAGLYVYNPTLAAGNLIASIAANSGSDSVGDAVIQGIANYVNTGVNYNAIVLQNGKLVLYQSATEAGPWSEAGEVNLNSSNGVTLEATGTPGHVTLTSLNGDVIMNASGITASFILSNSLALAVPVAITSAVGGSHVLGITQQTAAPAATIAQIQAAGAADKCLAIIAAADTQARLRFDTQANGIALHFGGGTTLDFVLQELSATCLGLSGGADFAVDTVGNGLQVKEGASAKQGSFTLVAGAHTVVNTTVTANSRIFLTAQDNNSTGALRVSARVVGTSFTVTSSNAADSGLVAYEIFEPAP